MTWLALRGLAARRTRAALTSLAIVLGVAMIAGSLILTDTIDRAFTTIYSGSYAQTDLVVRGEPVVPGAVSGAPTVPASLLPRLRALPGVAAAGGSLVDFSGTGSTAKLVGADGRVIAGAGPSFGLGVDPAQPRFNPLTLTAGHWASGGGQVVVDAGTASRHHLRVGDPVGVAGAGPVRRMTISGIARFGGVDSLGGATLAVLDLPTARAVLGKTGFDAIQVAVAPGASKEAVAREIAPLLPRTATVRTAARQADSDKQAISDALRFIRGFLLSFGGIALFVGAFVIFNTLSITVAQRSRELATLRTLGASRAQVLRSVVAEALAVGVAASLAGLALGWALARGLSAVFAALGAEMPQGHTVFAARTVVVALATGTLVTLLAGLVPAVRATRVAPVAAIRGDAAAGARRGSRRSLVAALAISGLAGGLLAAGARGDGLGGGARAAAVGAGALGLFVGLGMLSPRLVRPLAAVVGWPVARLGASGALARENAVRNPGRTASTAAALMIGLALVTVVAVVGAGLVSSSRSALRDQVAADWVVASSDGYGPVPPAAGKALAGVPGVRVASSIRHDRARVADSAEDVGGVDPSTIARAYRFDWAPGSSGAALARLDRGGVLVTRDLAEAHGLRVGSPVPIVTPGGEAVRRTVAGIFDPPPLAPLLGSAVLSQRDFDATFPRPSDAYTLVSGAHRGALEAALAGFPDARVQTVDGFAGTYLSGLGMMINMLYVLLALSVIVSMFGMVNTLVLSVHERTREIGMLRAVGMTRRQARRMVRGESIVTALIGAALGIPLGVGVAAVVVGSMSDLGVGLVVPIASLAAFALVAVLAGVVAAVTPARRASRLDVLRALQYQ